MGTTDHLPENLAQQADPPSRATTELHLTTHDAGEWLLEGVATADMIELSSREIETE
jgi:hypothetical protein